MKLTIGEVVRKLEDISDAINDVHRVIDRDNYQSLGDAAELLEEYRDVILSAKVDIFGGYQNA